MSTDPSGGPGGRLRASDTERESYADIVREAVGEGRLTLGEGDERLAAVYAVKYRDELPPLVTDLPRGQADPSAPTGAGPTDARGGPRGDARAGAGRGWPGPPRSDGPGQPPWGRRRGPGFGLGFVLLALTVLGVVSLATGAHFFWPAVPLIFLGLFLIRGTCLFRYGNAGRRRNWSVPPSI